MEIPKLKSLPKLQALKEKLPKFHLRKNNEDGEFEEKTITKDDVKMWVQYVLFSIYGIVSAILAQRYMVHKTTMTTVFFREKYVKQNAADVPGEMWSLITNSVTLLCVYFIVVVGFASLFILLRVLLARKMKNGDDITQTGFMVGVGMFVAMSLICWFGFI